MTAKLITLAGLLLLLGNPALAANTEPAIQGQNAPEPTRTAQAPQQPQQLAWQRVGAPLSLET